MRADPRGDIETLVTVAVVVYIPGFLGCGAKVNRVLWIGVLLRFRLWLRTWLRRDREIRRSGTDRVDHRELPPSKDSWLN